jgi:predicted DNA repair protein MutK
MKIRRLPLEFSGILRGSKQLLTRTQRRFRFGGHFLMQSLFQFDFRLRRAVSKMSQVATKIVHQVFQMIHNRRLQFTLGFVTGILLWAFVIVVVRRMIGI